MLTNARTSQVRTVQDYRSSLRKGKLKLTHDTLETESLRLTFSCWLLSAQLASQFGERVQFLKVDVDKAQDVAQHFNVVSNSILRFWPTQDYR